MTQIRLIRQILYFGFIIFRDIRVKKIVSFLADVLTLKNNNLMSLKFSYFPLALNSGLSK